MTSRNEANNVSNTGGPLAGLRVVELAGIGPGPHAALLLADLGADVVRVQRAGQISAHDHQLRSRTIVEANLKDPADIEKVLGLVERADVLIEGFRPGVTERLGLGPDDALARNPRLVYGRMTGWGQQGPWAQTAGQVQEIAYRMQLVNAIGKSFIVRLHIWDIFDLQRPVGVWMPVQITISRWKMGSILSMSQVWMIWEVLAILQIALYIWMGTISGV